MRKPGLTTLTVAGLVLGISVGLFVGEHAAPLQSLGDAFIMLLQMAVLPYFIITLILGLGTISLHEAKDLGVRGIGVLVLLWSTCFLVIFSMPLSFPELETASFFSASAVAPAQELDFLSLYIPANPFNTLAKGILPGVVIFGLSVGVALIGVQDKRVLVEGLTSLQSALIRITQFVVKLTPIGVFALAAAAAGTMTVEEFGRLQVYLIAYTVGAVLLTFWIVPGLIAALTPFSYREVFGAIKDPLVTGFTTGNLLVVLPLLTENVKALFHARALGGEHTDSLVGVTVPLGYPFPDIGTLLIMLFVPFAAWFSGNPMSLGDYPTFAVVGFFSFFGNVEIGMPFLLSQMRVPSDMFQLYLMTLVYIGRFATLVAIMHVAALAVLTTSAVTGLLAIHPRRLFTFLVVTVVLLVGAVTGTRLVLNGIVESNYTKDRLVTHMGWSADPLPSVVKREIPVKPGPAPAKGQSLLEAVLERGILRVGYLKAGLPFSFFNNNDELVGLDVELAHRLAQDLGVDLEFVPYTRETMLEQLGADHFDVAMSGVLATPELAATVAISEPYMSVNLALIVEDFRRQEFRTVEGIRAMPLLKVGIVGSDYLRTAFEREFRNATAVPVDSPDAFFEGGFLEMDALLASAEAGSAWTLLNPDFSVVVPQPAGGTLPLAYPVARRDEALQDYLNQWIRFHRDTGTFDRLYDHYILGKAPEGSQPRWSIIRDVLKWEN